jgi:hypothetical protein
MRFVVLAATVLFLGACHHATVNTGLQPSGQKSTTWGHGFIYGLVPPATVDGASKCPNGVAKVETQLSFPNQLVSWLTFGLYSPMMITVECAATRAAALPADAETISVSSDATEEEITGAFDAAAQRSAEQQKPVWISFE